MIERLALKKLAILSAFCGVSALCIAQNSTSGGQSANARDAGAQALEEVVITGSRRAQRSVLESMSPIDVIGLDDINRQGQTDLNYVLRSVVPSFGFAEPVLNGNSDAVRPATLRGLSPDQTLVLVNNKRRHRSAQVNRFSAIGRGSNPVDISQIPSSAIKQVEVLRDGASAQYGSDAIGGILNLLLKDDREGGNLSLKYGEYFEGDGASVTVAGNVGMPLTDDGFFNLSFEYKDNESTDRAGPEPTIEFLRANLPAQIQAGVPGAQAILQNLPKNRLGNPQLESFLLAANGGLDIIEAVRLEFFGTWGKRDTLNGNLFYNSPIALSGGRFSPRGFRFNPDGSFVENTRVVPQLHPGGFVPEQENKNNDFSFFAELSGEGKHELAWSLSAGIGKNRLKFGLANTNNPQLGANGPSSFSGGETENREMTFNADLSLPIEIEAFSSPLNVAFGTEFRRENYLLEQGDPASYQVLDRPASDAFGVPKAPVGVTGLAGLRPDDEVDVGRESFSLYVDLEADLTADFSLGLAGRFENYTDFGTASNYKVSARYQVSPWLALRSAYSTGFRAPTLAQSFFTRSTSQLLNQEVVNAGTFPPGSQAARVVGAKDLDPETAANISAGFVLTPLDALSVTADFYSIDIDGRIVLSNTIRLTAEQRAELSALGIFVSNLNFFNNGMDTRTRGMDLISSYSFAGNWGNLRATFGFNYNEAEVERVLTPGNFTTRREIGFFEVSLPKSRVNLGLDYSYNKLNVVLRANRFGSIQVLANSNVAGDETWDARWLIDLEASYQLGSGVSFSLGGVNITDEFHLDDDLGGFVTRDGRSPLGFNGGLFYARLNMNF